MNQQRLLITALIVGLVSVCGPPDDVGAPTASESSMENLLLELLESLERVGNVHEEVYDTDVREQMREAVSQGFISPVDGYSLPREFGMFSPQGNDAVREALAAFLRRAPQAAEAEGLNTAAKRLTAFQNDTVATRGEGQSYDSFFGHSPEP